MRHLALSIATGGALLLSPSISALFSSVCVVGGLLALLLLVDLACLVSFFCDLFPLVRLGLLVILSSSTLAPLGFSVLTFPTSVSALRFNAGFIVTCSCSSFVAERRGGLVCLGAVVVIAIGWECAVWCCAGCLVVIGCDGVCRLLEEEGGLVRGMKVTNHCV